MMIKKLDPAKIEELFAAAAVNPRRRTNYNFHDDLNDPINRLCIAALPGSHFFVQRHPDRNELLTVLVGDMTSYAYDDDGNVICENRMRAGETLSVEWPAGTWHNLVIHEPTIFLEVKAGPYAPVPPEDTAPFEGRH